MYYFLYSTIALFLGILVDLLIGDPKGWPHPVIAIGWLIGRLERWLRRLFPETKGGERLAGIVLTVMVGGISILLPAAVLWCSYRLHPMAGILVEAWICGRLLAAKSLKTESIKVAYALEREGLEAGRQAVSMIVGRDTERLDEAGVIRAAVETVAENTSDGVIAPLLFMAFFGGTGGFFYKAVNTMDSMVGYKNDIYQYFGTAAAKWDDFVNFIPARVSAVMMTAASFFCGRKMREAWRIFRRDRFCHASPNSAQTEAVMAGALQIQLAGEAWYFGKRYQKPTIGDDIRPVELADIARSNRLMMATFFLTAAVVLVLKFVCVFWAVTFF